MNTGSPKTVEPSSLRVQKWFGEPVNTIEGTIDEIRNHIPSFERRQLVAAPNGAPQLAFASPKAYPANKYCDVIVRTPFNGDQSEEPVGVVSKNYGLIQHKDLFEGAVAALTKAKVDCTKIKTALTLSEYKGRMALRFILPEEYGFNPGDGQRMALRLECFNSVDGSSRLWVVLGWFRFVCSNGLIIGKTRLDVRLIHNGKIQVAPLAKSLEGSLASIQQEQDILKRWVQQPVSAEELELFVDGKLRKRWGVRAAARVFLICTTGRDGKPKDPFAKVKPSDCRMNQGRQVPGARVPANNAFAVSQALTWIAKETNDVQKQLERTTDVPDLMAALLRQRN